MRRHRSVDAKACAVCGSSYTKPNSKRLLQEGLLDPESRQDENAIADAVYAHFERTLGPPA